MKTIRKHLFTLTLIMVLIIIIIVLLLKLKMNKTSCYNIYEESSIEKEDVPAAVTDCTVDIKGAIKNPGVYTTSCQKYVNDIISLAGGLNDNADTRNINLAKQITNEMVIIIYTEEETINSQIDNECYCPEITNDSCLNTQSNELININTAGLEELKTLPGIGDAKAQAIIEYRKQFGEFKSIEDIINVNGIGGSLYEQIKIYITT